MPMLRPETVLSQCVMYPSRKRTVLRSGFLAHRKVLEFVCSNREKSFYLCFSRKKYA